MTIQQSLELFRQLSPACYIDSVTELEVAGSITSFEVPIAMATSVEKSAAIVMGQYAALVG